MQHLLQRLQMLHCKGSCADAADAAKAVCRCCCYAALLRLPADAAAITAAAEIATLEG
jgi:hypothetical protein